MYGLDKSRLFEDPILCGLCKSIISVFSETFLSLDAVKMFQVINYLQNSYKLDYEESWQWGYKEIEILVDGLKKKTFNPNYLCEITLPLCKKEHFKMQTRESYAERILSDKPKFIKNDDFIDNLYKRIMNLQNQGRGRQTITVHHFSDFHLDYEYVAGESNSCKKLVCCRSNLVPTPESHKERAGKWGDYRCDTNPKMMEKLTSALKSVKKPAFTIWTGDNTDHGFHKNSRIATKASMEITKYFKKNFPEAVVFGIHGNHEIGPMSLQNFKEGADEAMKILAETWKDWMSPHAYKEYKDKSYYSMLLSEHPKAPKFLKNMLRNVRLIGYNSETCDIYNKYIVGEMGDSLQQLEWLEGVLKHMEQNCEIGIFFSHISPGMDGCFSENSARIQALMDRYQHVIRLNLFGHTHQEEYEIIRSVKNRKPIGVNHLVPSFTTINNQNPSFRVFTLDAQTLIPLSIETYTFDLQKANQDDKFAVFERNHEMTQEYNMRDLSPSSFYELSQKFQVNETLASKYLVNKNAGAIDYVQIFNLIPYKFGTYLNFTIKNNLKPISCSTSNSVYSDTRKCYQWQDLTGHYEVRSYVYDFLYGYWVDQV
ncbi:unnamed protein product [Moneuplotes crassus]|uniref:Sphingomyelin phosphodiesterase n=1 Tax=Euplotes crassus TaxID=5936 RepID=A0AAD1UCM7_EUPCR|nr:unnamed protein product [Moneuplotes crassus]